MKEFMLKYRLSGGYCFKSIEANSINHAIMLSVNFLKNEKISIDEIESIIRIR